MANLGGRDGWQDIRIGQRSVEGCVVSEARTGRSTHLHSNQIKRSAVQGICDQELAQVLHAWWGNGARKAWAVSKEAETWRVDRSSHSGKNYAIFYLR
jgi:hypothetical protein